MARLSYVEMEQASPEVREIYETALRASRAASRSCWRTGPRC